MCRRCVPAGATPKTLQWHQASLRALRRYLWRQLRLTDVCSLTGASLRAWLNELSIVPSARTGTTRTVNTVAAYARSARAFCNWLVRAGVCIRDALSERRRTQSSAGISPTGGAGGVCPPAARLSAPRLARRAQRRLDGAQPRYPLAFAGHGAAGLRVVRFTPRGCGPRRRNRDHIWKKRTPPYVHLVGGRAARRVRLSGAGSSHAGLGARGGRRAG